MTSQKITRTDRLKSCTHGRKSLQRSRCVPRADNGSQTQVKPDCSVECSARVCEEPYTKCNRICCRSRTSFPTLFQSLEKCHSTAIKACTTEPATFQQIEVHQFPDITGADDTHTVVAQKHCCISAADREKETTLHKRKDRRFCAFLSLSLACSRPGSWGNILLDFELNRKWGV